MPSPSVTELITNRSNPLMQPSTSVRNPGSSTCFSRWCSRTWRSSCSRSSPSPRMTNRASGISLNDQVRGLDQVPLAFVRHQRGDVADDRRLMGQPEGLVHVDRRRREHVLDVDAFVNRDRPLAGNAVGDQHLPDRFRRGDEAVDLAMFPARERIAVQMKVDAPRRDQRRRSAVARARATAPSDAIATPCGSCAWIDVGPQPLDDARETPGGREIHFGARRDRDQLEPLGRAPPQLAVRMGDERGALADRPQPVDGQQDLVLAAAPRPRRVDVQREHSRFKSSRAPDVLPVVGASQSFANLRKT